MLVLNTDTNQYIEQKIFNEESQLSKYHLSLFQIKYTMRQESLVGGNFGKFTMIQFWQEKILANL